MTEHPGGDAGGGRRSGRGGHRGHGWMMIACCVPMLLIAVGLVATGVAGPGFLAVAVMCTAMMALMMGAMTGAVDRGARSRGDHRDRPTRTGRSG